MLSDIDFIDRISHISKCDPIYFQTKVEALVAKFKVAMDDDFNTQNGITVVYELARELNVYAAREEVNRATLEYLLFKLVLASSKLAWL